MSVSESRAFIKEFFGGESPKFNFEPQEKKKFILNPDAEEFVPRNFNDYVLKIRFLIESEDHDGYCSDSYNVKTSEKYEIDVISIPKYLHNWLLFDSHMRLKDISILNKFNEKWNHGNGYCGCKSTKQVLSAKLIRNKKNKN
jgi:hypothetical protein